MPGVLEHRDVPVAAVLADQGGGVPEREQVVVGPGQVGVRGVQRAALRGQPGADVAGDLQRLADVGTADGPSPSASAIPVRRAADQLLAGEAVSQAAGRAASTSHGAKT